MTIEEGKAWPNASRGVEVDIQPAIIEVLRGALDLGRPYGCAYFTMFLRGVEDTKYLKGNHENLPGYGALKGMSRDTLTRVFHYMVDEGFLQPVNDSFSAFTISELGQSYMESPTPKFVHASYLKVTAKETFVYKKLREFRKHLASQHNMPEYQLFTDYTLDRVVMRMPNKAEQIVQLEGLNPFKLDMFGKELMDLLDETREEYRQLAQRRQAYFNSKPDHQYVKRLLEDGKNILEISKAMTYDLAKVENILLDLASTGEADVTPWIEGQVQNKTMFRATEYFRKAKTRSIQTARETLNLELATLHLCRLWVKVLEQNQLAVRQAS